MTNDNAVDKSQEVKPEIKKPIKQTPQIDKPKEEIKPTDRENYFPEYNKLYSDDNKIVLELVFISTKHYEDFFSHSWRLCKR